MSASSSAEPHAEPVVAAGDDRWLFGYGSLIFRPSFAYLERREAWIEGWTRFCMYD